MSRFVITYIFFGLVQKVLLCISNIVLGSNDRDDAGVGVSAPGELDVNTVLLHDLVDGSAALANQSGVHSMVDGDLLPHQIILQSQNSRKNLVN
jgi:hypothetical protein